MLMLIPLLEYFTVNFRAHERLLSEFEFFNCLKIQFQFVAEREREKKASLSVSERLAANNVIMFGIESFFM